LSLIIPTRMELARPGGNLTGINFITGELVAKRLQLLCELVPGAARVTALVNPANVVQTESTLRDLEAAARAIGLQVQVLGADNSGEIDAAFATLESARPDALFVASSAYFTSRRIQLVELAARHAIPASYVGRQFVDVGGLMSYGANLVDVWRQLDVQTGRVPQRRQAGRLAGRAGEQVRAGHQPSDRSDASPRGTADTAGRADEVIE
jgi:ABC-type uncharacterized transport system substrate-binding protein